jgi:PAS domain S-box-containing protein
MSKSNLCSNKTKLPRFLYAFWIVLFVAVYSPAERLPLKLYTSADGLASGSVFRVDRDSRGFLWFSTRDGLSRFDGQEFVNYRLGDQTNAPTFNTTLETRDGSFWISASDGLYRIKPDESEKTAPAAENGNESELYQNINAERVWENAPAVLFEDSRGRIWGGSTELSLIAENGEIKLQHFDLGAIARDKRGASVSTIFEGRDGSLWAGCDTGAIRILPDNRRILYPIRRLTDYDETRSIVEDKTGRIWIGHSTGVFVFQPESLVELQNASDMSVRTSETEERMLSKTENVVLPESPGKCIRLMFPEHTKTDGEGARQTASISRIFKSSDEKIWVPAGGSLFVFDGGNCRRYSDSNGFNGTVTDINEDAGGDIWLATEGGALRFNRAGLTSYGVVEGLTDPRVHSIYETPNGDLFVVHGDWRISRITENGIESTRLNVPDGDRFLWTSTVAFLDSYRNNWWAFSANGLYRFVAAQNIAALGAEKPSNIFGQKDGLASNALYAAFADSRGNLWFSSRNIGTAAQSGLARFVPETGEWRFFNAADGFPTAGGARSFAEDKQGNIWCGFYGGGLARFDGERLIDYSKQENFPQGAVLGLYFDQKNRLWFASTRDGLNLVENPSAEVLHFKRYTTEQGLASNQIRALTGDLRGNIYVGTVRGVDRINPDTGAVRHYSPADGLASDAITTVFADSRGRIWFGTPNGLSKLESSNESSIVKDAPQILINNLQIAGVNRRVSIFGRREIGEIKLVSSENNLSIGFLSVGENLRYQYKLEGNGSNEKDWSRPTTERTVNFAGLAPGDYEFSVRALDAENRTSERPAQILFSIAQPFWKTWEFIGAIVFVSALGVFLLDRFRVSKTRQVENALAKSLASERVARESETRFRTLANTASDAIITIDAESRIVFVNEAIEKVFGWKPDELIGENLEILMPKSFHRKHHAGIARYIATGKKNIAWDGIELIGRRKSGATVPIEISFGEFDLDGRHYFTGVARDISERKRHEYAIQSAREDRFRELQKVRTRIATDLHDDIGSSLTQIAVLSEVARSHSVKDEVKAPLERLSEVSNELVDAMADIVWAINPKKDSWRELVRRMRRFASDVLSSSEIEFELETPETDQNIQLGANIRREVFSIFKECVNNIVRHSGASFVEIEFEVIVGVVRLKIVDNGRGFDAAHVLDDNFTPEKGGNGLNNIRRRVADLNGNCEINSSSKGTIVEISIPLHKEHESISLAIYVDSDDAKRNKLY